MGGCEINEPATDPSVAFGDSSPGYGGAESRFAGEGSDDADSINAVPPTLDPPYSNPSRAFFASHSAFSRLFSLARGLPVRSASISRPVSCMAFRR